MIPTDNSRAIKWKGFKFPVSIKDFTLNEDSVVATYKYSGRDGAEQERVRKYRVFNFNGIFTSESGNSTPVFFANKLRMLNDNVPGTFNHPDFGSFECIMKNLQIKSSADNYESIGLKRNGDDVVLQNIEFSCELWEHLAPTESAVNDMLRKLFSTTNIKPPSDYYSTSLKYNTVEALFDALKSQKIYSGIDPIRHAEWLAYDYDFRKEAWDLWMAWLENGGVSQSENTVTYNGNQKNYTVKAGDYGYKIAKMFSVQLNDLFNLNRGIVVRNEPNGDQGVYWKNVNTLYPGDVILIPDNSAGIPNEGGYTKQITKSEQIGIDAQKEKSAETLKKEKAVPPQDQWQNFPPQDTVRPPTREDSYAMYGCPVYNP